MVRPQGGSLDRVQVCYFFTVHSGAGKGAYIKLLGFTHLECRAVLIKKTRKVLVGEGDSC